MLSGGVYCLLLPWSQCYRRVKLMHMHEAMMNIDIVYRSCCCFKRISHTDSLWYLHSRRLRVMAHFNNDLITWRNE